MVNKLFYAGIGGAVSIFAIILAVSFTVSSDDSKMPIVSEISNDKIKVYASFYPYYEFTKNVAGDKAEVKQYLPSGIEAHDWEPRAGEIQSLKDADVFVYNGLGMEPYVDNLINSGEFSLVFIKASEGITLAKSDEDAGHADEFVSEVAQTIEEFEEGHMSAELSLEKITMIINEHKEDGFDHGEGMIEGIEATVQKIKDGSLDLEEGLEEIHHIVTGGDAHEEKSDDKHGHDHKFLFDPHIWLDPILVKQQVNNIRDGLIKADPENAQYYKQNAASYNAKLDALDAKIKLDLASCKKDTIMPFHSAFTYFGDRYGIKIFAIGGIAPDAEASASEIAEFIDFVKDNDIKVIFAEELVDPRLAEVIASEANARVEILSPIEALTPKEVSQGITFLDKMEQNLDVLKVALECQ